MPTALTPHLLPATQDAALAMRRSEDPFVGYARIAAAFAFGNRDRAMYACEAASRRQVGDRSLTVTQRRPVRAFGVELEFNYGDRYEAVEVFNDITPGARAFVEGYTHAIPTEWAMRTDVTVDSGGEFVAPINRGQVGRKEVRNACRAIKATGGRPGGNQGVHVHVDVRDFDTDALRRLATTMRNTERALAWYVPQDRLNRTRSCQAPLAETWDSYWRRIDAAIDSGMMLDTRNRGTHGQRTLSYREYFERYTFVNWNAVLVQGSVEFRGLGNTLNPVKINTWIDVITSLVEFVKKGGEFTERVDPATLTETLMTADLLKQPSASRFLAACAERGCPDRTTLAAPAAA